MNPQNKILLIVLAQALASEAFSPLTCISGRPTLRTTNDAATSRQLSLKSLSSKSTRRKMSQWDEEEDDVTTKPTSFEQAGEDMKKQDDDDKLNSMGDFDANPSVRQAIAWNGT
jgi:hypothetical protein